MSKENNTPNIRTGGIGFPGLLTIVFVLLKAFDVVDWSWWTVFSPMIILAAFLAVVLVACFGFVIFMGRR